VEPRTRHYIDVAHGLTVCGGVLDVWPAATPDALDIIKVIADSIGSAPEKWPEPVE
jgi:hypothetical protein